MKHTAVSCYLFYCNIGFITDQLASSEAASTVSRVGWVTIVGPCLRTSIAYKLWGKVT